MLLKPSSPVDYEELTDINRRVSFLNISSDSDRLFTEGKALKEGYTSVETTEY